MGLSTASVRASDTAARLRGRWLLVARGAWLLLAVGLLANWIASLFAYHPVLRTVCTAPDPAINCQFWQPTPDTALALARLGLSLDAYANYFIAVEMMFSLVFWVVAAIIFWRKSRDWLGLFVSFVLLLFGAFGISDSLNGPAPKPLILDVLEGVLGYLEWPCLGILVLTFPTGRFAPRWSWLLAFWWVVRLLFALPWPLNSDYWPGWLTGLEVLATFGGTAGVQIYRYLRIYTPVQRQQTKWVVFGVAMGVTIALLAGIIGDAVPGLSAADSPYHLLDGLFTAFLFLPLPLTIGVAILRYRLWDIDTIINKALVYALLTGLLGALYAGLIIGLTSLAGALSGGQASEQPIILVISTLAIAVLFLPVRQRIQSLIDRRFYRRKYDAEQTLAAFSATLRNEVNLEQVSAQLLSVVQETMQPAYISLWLRQPEQPERMRLVKEK